MKALLIIVGVIVGILLLLVIAFVCGRAKLHITCRGKVRVVASILGFRYTLYTDEEDQKTKRMVWRSGDPDRVLRRELKRQKKAALKALKKKQKRTQKLAEQKLERRANNQPDPNLIENLGVVAAMVKHFYTLTRGKIRIQVNAMHIKVASDDAAKTAIRYGVIVQAVSYLFQWIESHYTHVEREDGDMTVETDYTATEMSSDIDIVCTVPVRHALKIFSELQTAYKKEQSVALAKAKKRCQNQ